MPSMYFPNMTIDHFPNPTPHTYQNWQREVKLWVDGPPGETPTPILGKLIHITPLSKKTAALLYMTWKESCADSRSVDKVMELHDARYSRTDLERTCAWIPAFTESKRDSDENNKDFWVGFARCASNLPAL